MSINGKTTYISSRYFEYLPKANNSGRYSADILIQKPGMFLLTITGVSSECQRIAMGQPTHSKPRGRVHWLLTLGKTIISITSSPSVN